MKFNVERYSNMTNEELFAILKEGNLSMLQSEAIAAVMEERIPTPVNLLKMEAA
jgi:hypothetical protein